REEHVQNRSVGLESNPRRSRSRVRAGYRRNRGLHENLRPKQTNGVPSEQRQFLHRLVIKNALDTRQKPDVAVLPRQMNISGLSLSLIGVLLLFFFGMPYRIRSNGQGDIVTEQTNAAEKAKDVLFSKLGFAGLMLIALGTFLQIVGTWVSS